MGHAQLFQVTIDSVHNVITYKPKFFLSHKNVNGETFFHHEYLMLMTSGTSIQVPDDMQNGKQTKF